MYTLKRVNMEEFLYGEVYVPTKEYYIWRSRHKGYTYGGDIYTEGAYSPWENASKLDYAKSSRA